MKLVSWNVNGLRACVKKGFIDFIEKEQPDIFCLQEVKAKPDQVDLGLNLTYRAFWNPAEKPGYSGVALYSKTEPLQVTSGLGLEAHDREGRVITAEYGDFFLVNVYTPNSQNELRRLPYRQNEWDPAFRAYLKQCRKKKPVIFCGDLNVAHQEIDLARPKQNERSAGFTREERNGFDRLITEDGFIDTFREFETGPGHYTWWSFRGGARQRNVGWRIDYVCLSPELRPRLKNAWILPGIMGSDHCPVAIELDEGSSS